MTSAIPAVFIPALLCDAMMYRNVIDVLDDRVAPHIMMSPKSSLADSAQEILSRAPAMFNLIGTSYGAHLALEIALAAPQRVSSLWLMGCDPGMPREGGPDLAAGLETTPDAVIDLLAGLVVRPGDLDAEAAFRAMARRVGSSAGANQARALAGRSDVTARLGELRMPTLILLGEQDALVPLAAGQKMAASMPNARFQTIAQCGHLPTLERPVESAALYRAFLDVHG